MLNLKQLLKYITQSKTAYETLSTMPVPKINPHDQENIIINNMEWVKTGTYTYTDFSANSTTSTLNTGFKLPPRSFVDSIVFELNTPFTGGSVSDFQVVVKIGTTVIYGSLDLTFGTSTIYRVSVLDLETFSYNLTPELILSATSIGDTLNHVTAGSFDIYLCINTLPPDYA